jgi:hypothetical protein
MKGKKLLLLFGVLWVCGLVGCASSPATPDLTGVTSYYVRANGNDRNAGISEEEPFRTLTRAVEVAAKTPVKKITVIGKLEESVRIEDTDPTIRQITKIMDATGTDDFAAVLAANVGIAQIQGVYDEPDPDEILITGKPGATGAEKAVLTTTDNKNILLILDSTIRLEYIEIGGITINSGDPAVVVGGGRLTLAKGTKIINTTSLDPLAGIAVIEGLLVMCDDAEVSGNVAKDNVGIYLDDSVLYMRDNAIVTGNRATTGNGGGIALSGSTLDMRDNALVTNNSAGNAGGGIITFTDTEGGFTSLIRMSGNARVTKNTAKVGGGILLQDRLEMSGNAQVTGNTATSAGGGVRGEGKNPTISKVDPAEIFDNTAPEDPDSNFTFR